MLRRWFGVCGTLSCGYGAIGAFGAGLLLRDPKWFVMSAGLAIATVHMAGESMQ